MISKSDFIEEFNKILSDKITELGDLIKTPEGRQMWGFVSRQILRGGKRFRPYLCYLIYKSYGGIDQRLLMDASVALEIFHTYVLMHDDVIDHDVLRYGGKNIVGCYEDISEPHIAQGMGIVAGDIVHSFAYRIISELSTSADTRIKCMNQFIIGDLSVNLGQQLDTLNVRDAIRSYSINKLEEISSYKSSGYSTTLPGDLGLTLANASKEDYDDFHAFAEPLGILYQLVDDYSDYFINKTEFNLKDKYRDFKQGKVTYPLFLLYKSDQSNRVFDQFGNKDVDDVFLEELGNLLEETGAKQGVESLINHYADLARSAINRLKIEDSDKLQFQELIISYRDV